MSRSKSLDWRTGIKSPERKQSYREDSWRKSGEIVGAEGSRVRSTVQAYNNVRNEQESTLSKARVQSLPSKLTSASLGPKGGQSIHERIEKLYGSSQFGNNGDYKTTKPQTGYKDGFGGTFPRRFSSGDHKPGSGQCQNQTNARQSEGTTFENTRFPDIGTQSLDRARSRSTIATRIRASRAAEEMERPAKPESTLEGIYKVSSSTDKREASVDMDRKTWSRTTVRDRNQAEDRYKHGATLIRRESLGNDVFMRSEKFKWDERKSANAKPLSESVKNKINQFEALTQRAQASPPRRAFSMPEHMSHTCDRVQRSSSARVIGTATHRWGGLKEESGQGVTENNAVFERDKKLHQDKTANKITPFRPYSVDVSPLKLEQAKEHKNSKEIDTISKLKTRLELPLTKDSRLTMISLDETDFSKIPEKDPSSHSCSEISTPTSDSDDTPTNTPDQSPLPSPQKTSPVVPVNKPLDISPPLITNLPDLVAQDNLIGKKRVLDLNAWLEGLNPQVKAWGLDGDDDDDDESTQRDEDSNYDSDSGESSVTITSVMSNKSFSVSLADLCNFAGAEYDSENDSDEWQSTGRRSASLSSEFSAFSCVSVLPTEELDKLIEDVKSIGDTTLQDYNEVHVVVLHKDVGVGLGFSLAGGIDQNKPVTVHRVFHSGVAAQEGSIKEGDRVLSINGSALSGSAHWEALRVLRRAKGREMGVVVLKKPDARSVSNGKAVTANQGLIQAQTNEKSLFVNVVLEKNERGLGFSLEGGVGSSLGNKPLSVQKIFQGGPVDKILPGDEVVEVNGVNVVGMRRLEVWTLIRKLPPGPVSVVLQRQPTALKA